MDPFPILYLTKPEGPTMIVYFTGTGNSRYCAEFLADRLQDRCTDAFHFIRDGIAADLSSEKPWVFVSPTYAWQIPRVFADFLRSGHFAGSRDAYFVMTCGSEAGNPVARNQALCQDMGLAYRGTAAIVMPENYIAMFSAPEPEEANAIIEAARPSLEQAADCIRAGQDFPALSVSWVDGLKSGLVNTLFYRFQIKAKPFTISDACVACGRCEAACPLGNILLQDGKPVWGDHCTHCMACICGCPVNAIEYGRISRGKPRYQCPPYKTE